MSRSILVFLALAGCDLTTHGKRGAPVAGADVLGPCCVGSVCVQPRVGQTSCDAGLTECAGAYARTSEIGPLIECRESSPVTENAGTSTTRGAQVGGILHGTIAAPGAGR